MTTHRSIEEYWIEHRKECPYIVPTVHHGVYVCYRDGRIHNCRKCAELRTILANSSTNIGKTDVVDVYGEGDITY